MKLGYDGTIRFDTRIDTAGVNEGIAKIGNSLKGAGKAFLGFGKSVGKVLAGIGKALTIGIIVLIVAAVAAIAGLIRLISSAGKAAASAGEDVLQQARKLEELKQTFAELKNAITDAFRPLILAAMPWITTVTNAVIRLLNLIAQVIASLTGQEGYWKTVEAGAEAAGGAADKAKGALAGFDKINVLDTTENQGGGGGGASQEWVKIGDEALSIADRIKAIFEEGNWYELGLSIGQKFSEGIAGVPWGEIGKKISDGIIGVLDFSSGFMKGFDWSSLGTGFADSINNIDWVGIIAGAGENLSVAINGLLDLVIGFIEGLDWGKLGTNIWDSIGAFLESIDWSGIVSRVFELLGAAIGGATALIVSLVTRAWEALKEGWESTKTYFNAYIEEAGGNIWEGVLNGIINAIKDIGTWIKEHIIDPFVDGFKKAFGITSPSTVMAELGGDLIEGLKQGILNAWTAMGAWISENITGPIKEWFSQTWESIKITAETKWGDIKDSINKAKDKIEEYWKTSKDWFNVTVLIPIKNFFTEKWDLIKEKVTGVWDSIKEFWEGAKDWFSETVLDPIEESFTNIWEGIRDTIKGVVNSIIGFINGMIQGIVNGVNAVIDVLNHLKFTLPSWIPGLGGSTFGFSIAKVSAPQIPYLATGAVIPPNAAFLAMLGDQTSGRNLEAPENLIRQIVREETARMPNQEITINFAGNLGSLIRVLKPYIDKENKRIGASLVAGRIR